MEEGEEVAGWLAGVSAVEILLRHLLWWRKLLGRCALSVHRLAEEPPCLLLGRQWGEWKLLSGDGSCHCALQDERE